jgi:MFS family permease
LTLKVLLCLALLNQSLKTGSNVTILLTALSQDASPFLVGALTAVTGIFPMLLAVSIGRLNDRFGARLPMFVGSVIVVLSTLLPIVWQGLPALFVTATLTSLGAMAFSVSVQNTVGHVGAPGDRAKNFSWLSIAFSCGGIFGPLIAGAIIDFAGYQSTFLVLAFFPLFALIAMGSGKLKLPQPRPAAEKKAGEGKSGRRTLDLLRNPRMRNLYLLTALHVSAWEVISFLVPVYGSGIGISASSIGLILGAFNAATFVVRIVLPLVSRRYGALTLIRASLVLAGVISILFPLTASVPVLVLLAFILGMGLGVTQPLAMSLLHEAAPEGRSGEAVGLRTAVVNLSGTTTPLIYGALGGALGMLPVFWACGVGIWIAVWALR